MNLILSHLFFANTIIGCILLVEVLVNFKRPLLLKILMLTIGSSVILANSSQLYFIYSEYNRALNEILRVLFLLSILNLLYIIYYHKLKRNILLFSLLLFVLKLTSLYYFNFVLKVDNTIRLNELHGKIFLLQIPRIISSVFYLLFCTQIYRRIVRSFSDNNIYFQKIKNWSKFILFSFYLNTGFFIFQFIFPNHWLAPHVLLIVPSFVFSLLLLFRPTFLNKSNLEVGLSDKFTKVNTTALTLEKSSLNKDLFTVEFFHKAYFSQKSCSLEDLSTLLGYTVEELKAFIVVNYHSSFTDLVNKSRVEMFIELIKDKKNNHLTIEGLSVMAGFGTRQNFHKAFKKFHGGNPSDLLKMYDNA